ncbi:MAG: hypothetical protein Q8L54_07045 [Devosia sp.]|nr:hypothetical protein [Devosia sp.]
MSGAIPRRRHAAQLVWLLVGVTALLLGLANAHLVYVAFQSQPVCLDHSKSPQAGGAFQAAKSAC